MTAIFLVLGTIKKKDVCLLYSSFIIDDDRAAVIS